MLLCDIKDVMSYQKGTISMRHTKLLWESLSSKFAIPTTDGTWSYFVSDVIVLVLKREFIRIIIHVH